MEPSKQFEGYETPFSDQTASLSVAKGGHVVAVGFDKPWQYNTPYSDKEYKSNYENARAGEQLPLFEHIYKPGKIDTLYSTGDPMLVVKALGVLHKRYGMMEHSDNLSSHSSKLVQHATDVGLVEENEDNPYALDTNTMDKARGSQIAEREHKENEISYQTQFFPGARTVSEQEFEAGGDHIKNYLRGIRRGRFKPKETPSNQLTLPGM